jgi:hypothetical protein
MNRRLTRLRDGLKKSSTSPIGTNMALWNLMDYFKA